MTPEIFLTRQRSEGVSPDRRLWFSVALCSRLHLLHGGPLLEIAICREQCQLWYSFYQPLELFPRQAFLYHLPAMLPAGLLLPLPCREPELSVAVAQSTVWVAAIWCIFGLPTLWDSQTFTGYSAAIFAVNLSVVGFFSGFNDGALRVSGEGSSDWFPG